LPAAIAVTAAKPLDKHAGTRRFLSVGDIEILIYLARRTIHYASSGGKNSVGATTGNKSGYLLSNSFP
jgi:hypothetical protein